MSREKPQVRSLGSRVLAVLRYCLFFGSIILGAGLFCVLVPLLGFWNPYWTAEYLTGVEPGLGEGGWSLSDSIFATMVLLSGVAWLLFFKWYVSRPEAFGGEFMDRHPEWFGEESGIAPGFLALSACGLVLCSAAWVLDWWHAEPNSWVSLAITCTILFGGSLVMWKDERAEAAADDRGDDRE